MAAVAHLMVLAADIGVLTADPDLNQMSYSLWLMMSVSYDATQRRSSLASFNLLVFLHNTVCKNIAEYHYCTLSLKVCSYIPFEQVAQKLS